MNELAVAAFAAVVSSSPVWRPVTIHQIYIPDSIQYHAPAGSVTNEYKKRPPVPECIPGNKEDAPFSLSCASGKSAGL